MRYDASDTAALRWEVLKSLLDNFPQLLDRTERYILEIRSMSHTSSADHLSSEAKELIQKAVSEYRKERPRK